MSQRPIPTAGAGGRPPPSRPGRTAGPGYTRSCATSQAAASGELDWPDQHTPGAAFIGLIDAVVDAAHAAIAQLRELIAERC